MTTFLSGIEGKRGGLEALYFFDLECRERPQSSIFSSMVRALRYESMIDHSLCVSTFR